MRSASEASETSPTRDPRKTFANFRAPVALLDAFREVAKRNERSFSQELRHIMATHIARERQDAAIEDEAA